VGMQQERDRRVFRARMILTAFQPSVRSVEDHLRHVTTPLLVLFLP
jgi:hypothetical protein